MWPELHVVDEMDLGSSIINQPKEANLGSCPGQPPLRMLMVVGNKEGITPVSQERAVGLRVFSRPCVECS